MKLTKVARALEEAWNIQPLIMLACSGGSDQHWQLFHPIDWMNKGMPAVIIVRGLVDTHPDASRDMSQLVAQLNATNGRNGGDE